MKAKEENWRMFLWGAQYYRAPTPEPECWEEDFRKMKNLRFNSVKFWVQWRWSHRRNDRFVFDDLDPLMDLAHSHGLKVHLNTIFDVTPHWLFEKYPDAAQIMNNGRRVEPFAAAHRQIGGLPGPCYSHPQALEERRKFLSAALEHFKDHPAMAAWDVWNEPELSFAQRKPDMDTLVCYCDNCRAGFISWLQEKYGTLEELNLAWSRCYELWDEVELPRFPLSLHDFVDWRLFHTDVMTSEAKWRLELVRAIDPDHLAFLHAVGNTMSEWSLTTCAMDEFAMGDLHENVYAASLGPWPLQLLSGVSSGKGRLYWNTESHVNFGGTNMHPRVLELPDLLLDWLPQIGAGVRGLMFWQFRAETRGWEAPAWGLIRMDGSEKPVTRAAREFWKVIEPISETLLEALPAPAPVGIWKSGPNEVFHFAVHRDNRPLRESVDSAVEQVYRMHYPIRLIDNNMVVRGELDDLKVLIMPSPYYLSQPEVDGLDRWVRAGGILLCDAHLAGYDATRGAHSRSMPGGGLRERWGIRETEYTWSHHLRLEHAETVDTSGMSDDARKALAASGTSGGKFYPITLFDSAVVWGAERFAQLEADDGEVIGTFDGSTPLIVSKAVGRGHVVYCGSNMSVGALQNSEGYRALVRYACEKAGVRPVLGARTHRDASLRIDLISDSSDRPLYATIFNKEREPQTVSFDADRVLRGLFTDVTLDLRSGPDHEIPAGFADLFEIVG